MSKKMRDQSLEGRPEKELTLPGLVEYEEGDAKLKGSKGYSSNRGRTTNSTTYNAIGVLHKGGELFAVAHPHAKTGFKLTEGKQKFDSQSSYTLSYGRVLGSVHSKYLQPYHPNAMRNRLPSPPSNCHRRRYKQRPSTGDLISRGSDYTGRFVTIQQRSYTKKGLNPTGFANQGIVAEATRWHHQRMND
eukprot:TRINITY_DN34263_c0_g1_i1.p1 TRINITY_DN34263_c0_g1~~TRINITY_DN34263_c0_g1_i1.p1  ORF type:complete len:189 (+),score=39.05 TRINITY_DN34263_c0_g1_i1:27-593(+)